MSSLPTSDSHAVECTIGTHSLWSGVLTLSRSSPGSRLLLTGFSDLYDAPHVFTLLRVSCPTDAFASLHHVRFVCVHEALPGGEGDEEVGTGRSPRRPGTLPECEKSALAPSLQARPWVERACGCVTEDEAEEARCESPSHHHLYALVLRFCHPTDAACVFDAFDGMELDMLGESLHISSFFITRVEPHESPDSDEARWLFESSEEDWMSRNTRSNGILPSLCPVCLEDLYAPGEIVVTTACVHVFHMSCIERVSDGICPICRSSIAPAQESMCSVCLSTEDLWICLTCGELHCGRLSHAHAQEHFKKTGHCYASSVLTHQVWDYSGDGFVHRLIVNESDGKMVESGDPIHPILDRKDTFVSDQEEEEYSVAVTESKQSLVIHELDRILFEQLEEQRKYYETLRFEVESKNQLELRRLVSQIESRDTEISSLHHNLDGLQREVRSLERKLHSATEHLNSRKVDHELLGIRLLTLKEDEEHYLKESSRLETELSPEILLLSQRRDTLLLEAEDLRSELMQRMENPQSDV